MATDPGRFIWLFYGAYRSIHWDNGAYRAQSYGFVRTDRSDGSDGSDRTDRAQSDGRNGSYGPYGPYG